METARLAKLIRDATASQDVGRFRLVRQSPTSDPATTPYCFPKPEEVTLKKDNVKVWRKRAHRWRDLSGAVWSGNMKHALLSFQSGPMRPAQVVLTGNTDARVGWTASPSQVSATVGSTSSLQIMHTNAPKGIGRLASKKVGGKIPSKVRC
ncbi:hypothetical protein CIRG_03128 [Coccidioides immitis RMSCC 2394]|uniref:Uncharacterized protein n=1 Tax=Coccidioides immitis RMSCC 2394 TaxID=404692 RepID=A0A0J6Y444_COCIT|nr:hypothetical protein CIRG_03128 [Coccidioides immitis RMSCC 2394]